MIGDDFLSAFFGVVNNGEVVLDCVFVDCVVRFETDCVTVFFDEDVGEQGIDGCVLFGHVMDGYGCWTILIVGPGNWDAWSHCWCGSDEEEMTVIVVLCEVHRLQLIRIGLGSSVIAVIYPYCGILSPLLSRSCSKLIPNCSSYSSAYLWSILR